MGDVGQVGNLRRVGNPPAGRWLIPPPFEGPLAQRVLAHRGVTGADAIERFLNPSLEDLHAPLTLKDMPQAVARLRQAISAGEKILIYGDYDVDGTTSVVLLTKAIELAGGRAGYHVPHRLKDGYGMRPEVVEAAAEAGTRLIVSVDTGIRAAEVVRHASGLGIDVIVTDHHLPESELPPALAVINPNRPDCSYPEKNLCGAGVAFKLAQALLATLGWPAEKQKRLAESMLKLVAIATVADVVPLTGENRVMVKRGLAGLDRVRNTGLRALLDVAGFGDGAAPTSRQVAFQIAPRLNAAGRMDTARDAVELFLTNDPARARELAEHLNQRNLDRRQVQAEIAEICEAAAVDDAAAGLVYYNEKWHRGVIGIVAGRLVEKLHRPVFVLGRNEDDGLVQGSGRSISSFHLLQALESMPDIFVRFGGHEHAAGVTLEEARVQEFRCRFNDYAAAHLRPEDLLPQVEIDATVKLSEITENSVGELFALAPFGHGNPPPLLAALDVEVASPPSLLKEKHLRIMVRQNRRNLVLKAWNFASRAAELSQGSRVDIAFSLEEDAYAAAQGRPGWTAMLRDLRPAALAAAE
ncbi:MAG TPA: single-stranded-DNA-specific exonuclease RecJ [Bryobacteraceae bacterium]|nr:single-stranded-DNA-specific exonuclease RecJ [Bryobacteraceae bacterium]